MHPSPMPSVMNTADLGLARNSESLQEELQAKPRVLDDVVVEVSNGRVDDGVGPNANESEFEGPEFSHGGVLGGEETAHRDDNGGSGNDGMEDSMKTEEPGEETEKFGVFAISDQNGGEGQLNCSEETVMRVNSVKRESSAIQHKVLSSCSQYDSMLSMFDEVATTGRIGVTDVKLSKTEGSGFENGDLVWGKVKSHPWWPGQVFSEEFASHSVRRSKREGYVLVAFFGDSSYGWFEEAELIPFDSNFDEKSKQTNSRTFTKAVEEAIDESSRRSALCLTCKCRKPSNFRPANVKGYFAVDVSDFEAGAVYSAKQIGQARESFQTNEVLAFVKQLAVKRTSNEHEFLNFLKKKAIVFAYRKAAFEEFDDTYAQAFGHQSERSPKKAQYAAPARVPLSGRLVIAEALGKGKNSATKPSKPKDQSKRDKFLFKRIEETDDSKAHPIDRFEVTSTAQSFEGEGCLIISSSNNMLQKRSPTITANAEVYELPGTVASDNVSASNSLEEKLLVGGSSGPVQINPNAERVDIKDSNSKSALVVEVSGPKKVNVCKRPSGETSNEKSVLSEKKKQRKTDIMSSAKVGEGKVKSIGKQVQIQDAPAAHQNKDDQGIVKLRFPKLLCELQALAVNPFHRLKKSPAVVRKVFLKFRSIVYQKSLSSMPSAEIEVNDTRPLKSSAEENLPVGNVKDPPSSESAKPPIRSNDQTKSSIKRGLSDRQEEKRAKKKKFDDVKSLASDRKANQGDRKEAVADSASRLVKPEPSKRQEPPVRAYNPTMLVMKFPQNGNLPSPNELRARFTRFGQLDHSQTRVFWKSSTCRVVFRHKLDAQDAHTFAVGSSILFGNADVRCFFREVEAEGPDSEPSKIDAPTVAAEKRSAAPPPPQPVQRPKSILKRSACDEGGSNGSRRGAARVKFILGGEETNRREQLMSGIKTSFEKSSSFIDGSSSTSQIMDYNSKNFQTFAPMSPLPNFPVPNSQFSRQASSNMHYNEVSMPRIARNFRMPVNPHSVPYVDVSQQMITLLTRCNDVVNHVTGFLGYEPYHPL